MTKRRRAPLPKPLPEFRIQGRFTPDGLVILRDHLTAHPEQSNTHAAALFNTTADTIGRYRKKFREESGERTHLAEMPDPPMQTPQTAPSPIRESPSPRQKHLPLPLPEFRIKRNFTADDVEQLLSAIQADPEKPNSYFAALFNTQKDTVRYFRTRIQKAEEKSVDSLPEPIVLEGTTPTEAECSAIEKSCPIVEVPENIVRLTIKEESPEEKVCDETSRTAFADAPSIVKGNTVKRTEDARIEASSGEEEYKGLIHFTTERTMDVVDTMHDILRSMREIDTEAVSSA